MPETSTRPPPREARPDPAETTPWTPLAAEAAGSLGPALVSGGLAPLPLYLLAPLVGALLAVPACRLGGPPTCWPGRGGSA